MVQWTSYLFIKGMTLWNTITDWISTISYYTVDFSKYVAQYFHTDHSTWYFLPFHSLPLSHKHIKNKIIPQWTYSATHRIVSQSNAQPSLDTYSIDWLSASLLIECVSDKKTYEYSIDEFLENFRIQSNGSILPTLRELFLMWCIDTHHWFSGEDHVFFKVIDSNGEFQSYLMDDSSLSFVPKHKKIEIKRNEHNGVRKGGQFHSESTD